MNLTSDARALAHRAKEREGRASTSALLLPLEIQPAPVQRQPGVRYTIRRIGSLSFTALARARTGNQMPAKRSSDGREKKGYRLSWSGRCLSRQEAAATAAAA